MSEKQTGGPAFGQVIDMRCVRVDPNGATEWEPAAIGEGGLTVRDYFAANVVLDLGHYSVEFAQTILERDMPDYTDNPIGNARFWAEFRARMRAIEADAMIAARAACA